MRIYLACPFSDRPRAARVASILRGAGHEITSTWLSSPYESDRYIPMPQRPTWAETDLADVRRAELLIVLTADAGTRHLGGARHFEAGYALALRKRILVVGEREILFYWSSRLEYLPTVEAALAAVARDSRWERFIRGLGRLWSLWKGGA